MDFIELPTFIDSRGSLAVWDCCDIPFIPKRAFWIYHVPEGETRADHGHKECEQAIFAVNGCFMVNDVILHRPGIGLYVPINTVIKLHSFSPGAVALVLCSKHYDESEVYRLETE